MSLPLRFKAVCTETGRVLNATGDMRPPEYINVIEGNVFGFHKPIMEPNVIICQSTGLHDSNGREVFEGDVVTDGDGGIAVVAWDEKSARFGLQYIDPDWLDCDYASMYLDDRVVIGNRWQPHEQLQEAAEKLAK